MVIENGKIELKRKSGGGIDPDTGYPRPLVDISWSRPVPCQYVISKQNYLNKVAGGDFEKSEYTILIEEQEQPFEARQLRLRDSAGRVRGEFSIVKIEPLEAVGQIRIYV